jgi:TolB-like protein
MLRINYIIASLFLFTGIAHSEKQNLNIAVSNIKAENFDPASARIIADRLRSELVSTGAFTVIEREKMEEILKEQGFQQTGCVDESCAVEIGQLLGVSHIIAGTIGRVGKTSTLTVRVIDVTTGRIKLSESVDCQCSVDDILTVHTRTVAVALAEKLNGDVPLLPSEPGRVIKGTSRSRMVRRILFGGGTVGFVIGGFLIDHRMKQLLDDNDQIKKTYASESTNENYEAYRDRYKKNYDDARSAQTIRNVLYGAAGAFSLGFAVSIPF